MKNVIKLQYCELTGMIQGYKIGDKVRCFYGRNREIITQKELNARNFQQFLC